jgi:DNA-binding transcriptional regulator YiaG
MGGWTPDDQGRLTYRHLGKRGGQIVIYLDPAAVLASEGGTSLANQWSFVARFSPLTADVLLAVLAQLCEPGQGNRTKFPLLTPAPITAAAILRYKDLRRWGAEGAELRQRVDEEVVRLQGLRFDVHQFPAWDPDLQRWNAKGVSVVGDRLFDIVDSQTYNLQREGAPARSEIVWLARVGHWSQWWMNSQAKVWLGAVPRHVLEFDHRRNRGSALLAKKISLNTMVLWCAVRSRGSLERRIGHLLEDIGELPELDARDSHWAGRIRDRFDEAILMLQEAGVFGSVEWPEGCEPGGSDRAKGWVESWLSSKIVLNRPDVFGGCDIKAATRKRRKRRARKLDAVPAELRRGSVIRSMRMDRNISQSQFARELGISAAYLSQIETEKRMVSQALLGKISEWARTNGPDVGERKPSAIAMLDSIREQRMAIGQSG